MMAEHQNNSHQRPQMIKSKLLTAFIDMCFYLLRFPFYVTECPFRVLERTFRDLGCAFCDLERTSQTTILKPHPLPASSMTLPTKKRQN